MAAVVVLIAQPLGVIFFEWKQLHLMEHLLELKSAKIRRNAGFSDHLRIQQIGLMCPVS